ncbi:hypothetical protein [Streptomyces dioscori]|uniref:hypothetical protein n=1 Tax=Streptomyces dioscori TaxID=2109333 RepID=UPI00131CFBCF|nr:hypothetical protein [Streptomyces dioscori]
MITEDVDHGFSDCGTGLTADTSMPPAHANRDPGESSGTTSLYGQRNVARAQRAAALAAGTGRASADDAERGKTAAPARRRPLHVHHRLRGNRVHRQLTVDDRQRVALAELAAGCGQETVN